MTTTLILLYIFLWLLVILFFIVFIILCLWVWTGLRTKVPFISVPYSILPDIEKALNLREGSVVYDLGSGDARVLTYLAQKEKNKNMKFIGIENGLLPLCMSRITTWWNKRKGKGVVEIVDIDFFNYDLKDATHIFMYLYPNIMDDLLGKFDKELSPGTLLVSTTFKFTQKKPSYEINLSRKSYQLAQKLYVYEF